MTPEPATRLQLTVIGAGPAYSDEPGSIGACYLVETAGAALALDLGHGAFARLAARTRPQELRTVLISHLHPDHFVDLVPLRHFLKYHVRPAARIRVDAHPELSRRLDDLHAESGFTAASLDVVALEERAWRVEPFELQAVRVTHTANSYAFRVSAGGAGLVYSGDVGRADDLRPLIRPGDTLLAEVSFGPGPVIPGAAHLDGPAVGRLAAGTGAGHVLLTHLLPGVDRQATIASVRAAYPGPVDLVAPGDQATI